MLNANTELKASQGATAQQLAQGKSTPSHVECANLIARRSCEQVRLHRRTLRASKKLEWMSDSTDGSDETEEAVLHGSNMVEITRSCSMDQGPSSQGRR